MINIVGKGGIETVFNAIEVIMSEGGSGSAA